MKRFASIAIAPALLATLAGCVSMRPTMTSFSLDYNRVVADARNRMILLNIVRAAYREPTYYTALSQIEGSLNLQGSVTGAVTDLVGGGETGLSPSISGSLTNAPTFTIVPLTSEEFSKGMLTPIDGDTIRLLLSQGWRSEMLAPLIVEKVQCGLGDQIFAEIENQPSRYDEKLGFGTFAQIALLEGKADTPTPFRFAVPSDKALSIVTSGALDKFDIDQAGGPDPTQALLTVTPKQTASLAARLPEDITNLCRKALSSGAVPDQPHSLKIQSDAAKTRLSAGAAANLTFAPKGAAGAAELSSASQGDQSFAVIVFRSPDEIVYYLGELLREQLKTGKVLAQLKSEREAPQAGGRSLILFDVQRNAPGPANVAVEHHGVRWSIPLTDPASPETEGIRTMEVVALLNELIASQTSAADFSRAPSSIRVR